MDTQLKTKSKVGGAWGLKCALVSLGLAPTLALNCAPRVSQAITAPSFDLGLWGLICLQITSLIIMACCPFAAEKAKKLAQKIGIHLLGIFLALLNFAAAVESTSHTRDEVADTRRGRISRAATVQASLSEAK